MNNTNYTGKQMFSIYYSFSPDRLDWALKRNVYMTQLTEDRMADIFNSACATIGQNPDKIKYLYPDASFNLIHSKIDSVLEITTEYFTLSCLIDSGNQCEAAYIFINKEDELEVVSEILKHCKQQYWYSFLLKMWVNKDFGISLQVMEQSISFAVSRITPLPDDLQRYVDWEFSQELN